MRQRAYTSIMHVALRITHGGCSGCTCDAALRDHVAMCHMQALAALKSFVHSLGVEEPAATEAELLLQAAPYMSESLADNLKQAWTPEERARLDAQPMPQRLDHTNRDHEYVSGLCRCVADRSTATPASFEWSSAHMQLYTWP